MGYHRELEAAVETMKALRKRGVRILPGGDYGFAWTPHGTNAKDLEYFVKYVGMSTMEALLSATAWGGPMMKMGKALGYVREGCLADLLLIDGDPLADITVLQDKARILAVMKDGEFHRAPPRALARARRAGPPEENAMRHGRRTLFTNVRILDGTGAMPYTGSVLVQGNRIRRSAAARARDRARRRDRDRRRRRHADARHVRGAHALLVERRGHARRRSRRMPLEEHVLWCAKVAKRYLEAGFTSCVGAACAKPRLDVVIRNAINSGQIPGPALPRREPGDHRASAASATRRCRTCRSPSSASASTSTRADEMRKAVRMFLKYGVDSIKLNLSGDNFTPRLAGRDHLDERRRGRRGDGRGARARQARHRARALGGSR